MINLARELEELLPPRSERRFGDLTLRRNGKGVFSACHRDDEDSDAPLTPIQSVPELREWAKFTAEGEYRPLKTAPTLKPGWITETSDPREFLQRLDSIYPGLFATWIAYERGEIDAVPLRETLDRQTGMYRFAGAITDQMANRIMRELCSPDCVRKIAWPIDGSHPVSRIKPHPRSIPAICAEACTLAVSKARALAREAYDKENAPEG